MKGASLIRSIQSAYRSNKDTRTYGKKMYVFDTSIQNNIIMCKLWIFNWINLFLLCLLTKKQFSCEDLREYKLKVDCRNVILKKSFFSFVFFLTLIRLFLFYLSLLFHICILVSKWISFMKNPTAKYYISW